MPWALKIKDLNEISILQKQYVEMLKDLALSYTANTEFDLKVSYLPLLETTLLFFMNLVLVLTAKLCRLIH